MQERCEDTLHGVSFSTEEAGSLIMTSQPGTAYAGSVFGVGTDSLAPTVQILDGRGVAMDAHVLISVRLLSVDPGDAEVPLYGVTTQLSTLGRLTLTTVSVHTAGQYKLKFSVFGSEVITATTLSFRVLPSIASDTCAQSTHCELTIETPPYVPFTIISAILSSPIIRVGTPFRTIASLRDQYGNHLIKGSVSVNMYRGRSNNGTLMTVDQFDLGSVVSAPVQTDGLASADLTVTRSCDQVHCQALDAQGYVLEFVKGARLLVCVCLCVYDESNGEDKDDDDDDAKMM